MKIRIVVTILIVFCLGCFGQELITLSKALELAAQHSPDLMMSALTLEKSQANLEAQNASLKSDFSLQLNPFSYSNQLKYDDRPGGDGWYNVQQTTSGGTFSVSQPILITDATLGLSNNFKWQDANGDQSFYNNLILSLNQPLFKHNAQKMALKEVELEVEDAEFSYALQKLSMEKSITQGFYSLYQRQMQVLINEEELINQKQNSLIIKQKVDLGLLPQEEYFQSEVNLISSETSLESSQVTLADAKDDFIVLLGLDFDYNFMAIVNVMMDSVPVDQEAAITRSMQVKRELFQREIDIELAQFALIQTKDNDDFQGNLSVQVGFTGQDASLVEIFDKPTNNTGIGFSLEIPIWDWGKRKAQIRSAEISLEKQELLLEDDKVNIRLTIRKLYRNLASLLHQIEKAEKNVYNAQMTYNVNAERYKNGDITSMDLQLFQNQLSEKKMAQTTAIINYKLELLNMKIQTLYDWEKREDVLPENLFTVEN